MNRRDVLRSGSAGLSLAVAGVAGCLSDGSTAETGSPGSTTTTDDGPQLTPSPNVTLAPPDDVRAAPEQLPWPAWNQQIPSVTLPAPLQDRAVTTTEFDTPLVLTFIYTNCQTQCPLLTQALTRAQTAAKEAGDSDAVNFAEITFDPARDTEQRLEEYANNRDVDLSAGNWYFLRPPTEERAKAVVQDQFGLRFEKSRPEDMDMYMFTHRSLILLVNSDNYVERTYGGGQEPMQSLPQDLKALGQT